MPLYEYQCESCGRRTEALQRLDDAPLSECPECKGKLRKLLSAPSFQFKGSGWYLTDYARKGAGGAAGETGGGQGETKSTKEATEGGTVGGKASGDEKAPDAKPAKPAAKSDD